MDKNYNIMKKKSPVHKNGQKQQHNEEEEEEEEDTMNTGGVITINISRPLSDCYVCQ